jgi:hypothetical protein
MDTFSGKFTDPQSLWGYYKHSYKEKTFLKSPPMDQ